MSREFCSLWRSRCLGRSPTRQRRRRRPVPGTGDSYDDGVSIAGRQNSHSNSVSFADYLYRTASHSPHRSGLCRHREPVAPGCPRDRRSRAARYRGGLPPLRRGKPRRAPTHSVRGYFGEFPHLAVAKFGDCGGRGGESASRPGLRARRTAVLSCPVSRCCRRRQRSRFCRYPRQQPLRAIPRPRTGRARRPRSGGGSPSPRSGGPRRSRTGRPRSRRRPRPTARCRRRAAA